MVCVPLLFTRPHVTHLSRGQCHHDLTSHLITESRAYYKATVFGIFQFCMIMLKTETTLTTSLHPQLPLFPAASEHQPEFFFLFLSEGFQQSWSSRGFPGEEATGSRRMIKTGPLLGQHKTPGFIIPATSKLSLCPHRHIDATS